MVANHPSDKDVERHLVNNSLPRRQRGEAPYPIEDSRAVGDINVSDGKFLYSYCNGPTTVRFSRPPKNVLDLGCGNGGWVIETGLRWPDALVVGFDIADVQPKLNALPGCRALATRVMWVRGNFLDGLPFSSEAFDFVRMCKLALAIPEDEWQTVLTEVHRVLRPGGVVEIIEEDPIFPCASEFLTVASPNISSPASPSSQTFAFPPASPVQQQHQGLSKSKSMFLKDKSNNRIGLGSPSPESSKLSSKLSVFRPGRNPSPTSSRTVIHSTSDPTSPGKPRHHPQDHDRLSKSWDAMLAKGFLSDKPLSHITHYLISSSFDDVRSLLPLSVHLPPNSGSIPMTTIKTSRSASTLRSMESRPFVDNVFDFGPPLLTESNSGSRPSFMLLPNRDAMHLLHSMTVVSACKEAIWRQWEELYGPQASSILERVSPDDEALKWMHVQHLPRHAFEAEWRNWECDMIDRTNMQNSLKASIGWNLSKRTSNLQPGAVVEWRSKLADAGPAEGHLVAASNQNDLCRSLRVFVGFKAKS